MQQVFTILPHKGVFILIEGSIPIIGLANISHNNRLEKLVGDRKGQYSILINDQWRTCFVWTDENNASEIEIVYYH
ncbi:MAG: type II toxin-antitoxin system RelE/ParE family toxin [Goleter apudmare HA4340-LM2]|nr:type II toxin-antitoxin system RelE/ParE family toxin [Goleter apudmare HA4340-LM2]